MPPLPGSLIAQSSENMMSSVYPLDPSHFDDSFSLELLKKPLAQPNFLDPISSQDVTQRNQPTSSQKPTSKSTSLPKTESKQSQIRTTKAADSDKKSRVSPKRAEQNRAAQKAFRERKLKYVKDLEDKLELASKQLQDADILRQENSQLHRMIEELRRENLRLRGNVVSSTAQTVTRIPSVEFSKLQTPPVVAPASFKFDLNRLKHEVPDELYHQLLLHMSPQGQFSLGSGTQGHPLMLKQESVEEASLIVSNSQNAEYDEQNEEGAEVNESTEEDEEGVTGDSESDGYQNQVDDYSYSSGVDDSVHSNSTSPPASVPSLTNPSLAVDLPAHSSSVAAVPSMYDSPIFIESSDSILISSGSYLLPESETSSTPISTATPTPSPYDDNTTNASDEEVKEIKQHSHLDHGRNVPDPLPVSPLSSFPYVPTTPSSELTDPFNSYTFRSPITDEDQLLELDNNNYVPIILPTNDSSGLLSPNVLQVANDLASGVDSEAFETPLKRNRDEAKFYTAIPSNIPKPIFSKNEHAERDHYETELCEKLRAQAQLRGIDPSECNKSKFMKTASQL